MEYKDFKYQSINMYKALQGVYGDYLREEITSVSMIQSEDTVWLEVIEEVVLENGLVKRIIHRDDLSFIIEENEGNENELFFSPKMPGEYNVKKFIEDFSIESVMNTTNLFKDEVLDKINK